MCGIAGFAGRAGDAQWHDGSASARLSAMCDAIRHRGPDDSGYRVSDGAAIGMRRLSIIDVAGGHQPIGNEDGSVHVVFNGEIYNFRELQARLRAGGHALATRSDTETLVHLYEDLGARFVHELRGMFGLAIWDDRRRRLLIVRDRLGIKPLYYWPTADGVAFASELRALLTLPDFPRSIDRDAVVEYIALGYVPEPRSIFAGVFKLPAGHLLQWSAEDGLRVDRYWSPVRAEHTNVGEQEAIEETRRLLDESVSMHLESEVPLGAFLSGGIDSSGVVAAMSRLTSQPVRTFSIGFREREFDESVYAAEVAQALGTRHTALVVRPDADMLFEEVARALDEPFADPSALPTFLVSHLARRDVTVALSGDGGDELFGGYTRYMESHRATELPASARSLLRSVALTLPHIAFGRNRLLALGRTMRGRYAGTVALPVRESEGGILRKDVAERARPFDHVLDRWFDEATSRDFMTQLTIVDIMSYLPGDILTKVDRMSMAHSLEARVPLLDHVVAEFALALPSRLKLRDGVGKWVLRRAIADQVPRSVLNRPKQGFDVPIRDWFRGPLSYRLDALLDEQSAIYEWAEPRAVRRIVSEHRLGRRDHARTIWRLLMLDRWCRLLASGELAHAVTVGPDLHALIDRAAADGALAQSA
jgi:asparagine synthase (glutamine-hydrolysing)